MKLRNGMTIPATLPSLNRGVSIPLEYRGREAFLRVHGEYLPELAVLSVYMEVGLGGWVCSFKSASQDWKDRWMRYGHEVLFMADMPEDQRQLPDGLLRMIEEQLDYLIAAEAESEAEATA